MALANLGSISNEVHKLIEDIPTNLSGTNMLNAIDQERVFMESYLGLESDTIGSTAIVGKYQPAMISLSASSVLRAMGVLGMDVASIHLGDFSESKGANSNVDVAANYFKEDGMRKLDSLMILNFHSYKANG